MKLSTAAIIPTIIRYAAVHVHARFDPADSAAFAAASNPQLWKRASKSRLKKMMADNGLSLADLAAGEATWGCEFDDTLDPQPLSEDCYCRHFINDVLNDGLDPLVITDPADSKILRIFWHAD